jgi:hypothetical protein
MWGGENFFRKKLSPPHTPPLSKTFKKGFNKYI